MDVQPEACHRESSGVRSLAPMVTSRMSACATPVAVGLVLVISARSPSAVRPPAPRFTAWAGPPAAAGRLAAYDSTNPVHSQTVAEVTESPMPTTVAEPGANRGVGVEVGGGVVVGVATDVAVATAFGGVDWGNPSATLGPEEDVATQIAAGNSKAPAVSHTRLGRRGSRRRDLIDPTIRTFRDLDDYADKALSDDGPQAGRQPA